MSSAASATTPPNLPDPAALADPESGRLRLAPILDRLQADGLIDAERSAALRRLAANDVDDRGGRHRGPLERIAQSQWTTATDPAQAVDLDFLSRWLAATVALPWQRIDPLQTDVNRVTSLMSAAYARRFNIIGLEATRERVLIGTAEPFVTEWRRELEPVLKRRIDLAICNPDEIRRYLDEFYSVSRSVLGARDEQAPSASAVQNLEQLVELGRHDKLDANDRHVVSLVDWLLQYAYEQRASDIHLEPRRDTAAVRFRIDGVMQTVYEMPASVMAAVTSRLKILARLDVAEKRRPQDGRLKTRNAARAEVELRVSTMPTAFGEKMVMRIFDPTVLVKDRAALGLDATEAQVWSRMLAQPNGMVLVTGPTGSGKTTTLYSSLQTLATPAVNVCTVEDPIELVVPAFNQMQVQPQIDLDFATGIRTLLRQDPDIIMVGEIRDLETAQMAVQAALTGHLVLSTLHTNDAPSAVTRLLELGVPYYLIRSTLLGVIAQRLVRTLCDECASPASIPAESWQALLAPWKGEPPTAARAPTGCERCRQSGYHGRVGIYEILEMNGPLKALVGSETNLEQLRRQAFRDGMRPLRVSGLAKVAEGITTVDEIVKVTPAPLVG